MRAGFIGVLLVLFAVLSCASAQYWIPSGGGGFTVPIPTPTPEYPSMTKYSVAKSLYPNVEQVIKIPEKFTEISGVVSVSITPKERITIILLISVPKSVNVSVPNADVYKYFEVQIVRYWKLTPVKFTGYIEFRVPKKWVDNVSRVVLMKYDKKWKELPTNYVKEDAHYYYFKSKINSTSLFAIVSKPAPVPTPTLTPTPTPVKTPTPPPSPTKTPKSPIPGFESVLAIACLLAVAYLIRRR